MTDAVRRIPGVDRDVGSACFEAREDADDRKLRPAREYPDERSRAGTRQAKTASQPVRRSVELGVGEPAAAAHDRGRIRCRVGLPFEDLVQARGVPTRRGRRLVLEHGRDTARSATLGVVGVHRPEALGSDSGRRPVSIDEVASAPRSTRAWRRHQACPEAESVGIGSKYS